LLNLLALPCYPNINRFYPFGDCHSPSPNDESLPTSTLIPEKTKVANHQFNLTQANLSQPASQHPALSAKLGALGVLKKTARGSAEQVAIRWHPAICQSVDLCKELRQSGMGSRVYGFSH